MVHKRFYSWEKYNKVIILELNYSNFRNLDLAPVPTPTRQ